MAKWGEGDPRWIVEERPDATNVNNWHWSEKNACRWSQTKLQDLLNGITVEGKEGSCVVTEVSKCEGEAMVNNRKGRLIFFYEWNLELKWKAGDKDEKKNKAQGKISIPNMSEENSIEEVDVTATVEENTDFAFNMKTLMNTEGAKLIRQKLSEYLQALKDEFSQGLILPSKDSVDKKTPKAEKPAAPAVNNTANKQCASTQLAGAVKSMNIDTTSFSARESLFCPINEAYKCFTDQKMVEAFTHGPIKLEAKPGGIFEFFNGNISGEFIELEENKKIRQYWRNKTWACGHKSVVELTFEQTNDGTHITLNHSAIPYSELDATKAGWEQYYWRAIKQTFGFGSFIGGIL